MLRQVRSPACGSPETSSTRSRSRTPLTTTTARLLARRQLARPPARPRARHVRAAMVDRGPRSSWSPPTGTVARVRGSPSCADRHLARSRRSGAPAGPRPGRSSATSLPTRPKLGAFVDDEAAVALVGAPVSSTCTGAPKPSALRPAGTSCTWPSVIMTAPARRRRGTSASARASAVEQPRAAAAGARCCRRRRARRAPRDRGARGCASRPRRAPSRSARRGRRSAGSATVVDHDHGDVVAAARALLDQRRVGRGAEQADRRQRRARRCRAPAATGQSSSDQQRQRSRAPAIAGHGSSGANAMLQVAEPLHCPSRSRIAGTCTWSDL